MVIKDNIFRLIKSHKDHYSPKQTKIASYLIENYEKAAFLTATQLAKEIGVSQPTVIRFAQFLGFSSYGIFTKAFQDLLKENLTSTDRLNISLGEGQSMNEGNMNIISREIRTFELFANSFPQDEFQRLVEQICDSNKIYIVGTRGSASLSQYFAYFLGKIKKKVYSITAGSTSEYEKLISLQTRDLVIAIAFPRYPRETVEIIRFCHERRIKVAGITDKLESPLADLSKILIIIPITFSTIFDSYSSAFCLFNMIVTEVGRLNRKESEELIREFEALAKKIKIFL
jgi:DNA-binding MurR/RpiR family transcriptional regulator